MIARQLRIACATAVSLALCCPPALLAAPGGGAVTISSQGQSLKTLLEQLGGKMGERVRVSPRVNQPVHGTWTATPARLFDQLVSVMNLAVSRQDGVISVYRADELRSDSFQSEAPGEVVAEAKALTNKHNRLRAGKGLVHASGTPDFLAAVERITARIKAPAMASRREREADAAPPPIAVAAVPVSAPITSPALAGLAVAQTPAGPTVLAAQPTAYQILRPARPKDPYEIRAYRLRYESAGNRMVRQGRYEREEPGVAAKLREAMGLGTFTAVSRREVRPGYIDARPNFPADGGTVNVYGNAEGGTTKQTIESSTVEGPSVMADDAQNQVIIRDLPARMPSYEALINQFDVPRRQVEVEVAIIDVQTDKAREYGVDLGVKIGGLVALFGGLGSTGALAGAGVITNDGDVFAARLNGLQRRGIARVVNRFNMIVRENATETYSTMAEVPYEVEGRNGYLVPLEAGTRITATPRVVQGNQGRVSTTVRIEIEDAAFTALSNQKIPSRRVTSFSGEPEVPQGNSVMLAGQTVEQEFDRERKTPILGDVPLAGQLFKKGARGTSRTERLFLITPRILAPGFEGRTQAQQPVSFDEMDRARVVRAKAKRG